MLIIILQATTINEKANSWSHPQNRLHGLQSLRNQFIQNDFISCQLLLRALALKNANAISKAFLAFHGSKTCASKNCKPQYCKFFCNSATVQF